MTLIVLALCWLLGIAAVGLWGAPVWMAGAWLLLALPLGHAWRGREAAVVMALGALLAVSGAARYHAWEERPLPRLAEVVGSKTTLEGRVVSEPDPGQTTTSYVVEVERADGEATAGKVRVTLSQFAKFDYGSRLRLTGDLKEAPVFDDFDYRAYLLRQDIVGTMYYPKVEETGLSSGWRDRGMRALTKVRLELEESLQRALPEPEASLGAGVAFGRDSNLPPELYDDFRATGLAHIVAVSGTNVLYVAAFTFLLLTPVLGRRWATAPAGSAVVAYVLIAGLSPSVLRAGIMAVVYLLGAAIGRPRSSLAALGIAAVAMTAISPASAADVGFQLSLAATGGLIAFGPWFEHGLGRLARSSRYTGWVPHGVVQAGAITLSATLATLPITWVTFGRVSLVGPATNIIVEPVFVLAFWGAIVTAVAGLAYEPAGWLAGLVAYYPLAFTSWVATTAAELPGASTGVSGTGATVAFFGFVGLGAAGWPAYRYRPPELPWADSRSAGTFRRVALLGLAGATLAAVAPISLLPLGGPGDFEMTVLDVGQGDAILLTTPHGKHVLVDGGPSGIELARELGATLPHWERRIDAVFLTHPQMDHIAGLPEVARRFTVRRTYDTGVPGGGEAYDAYRGGAGSTLVLAQGDTVTIDGVRFEVLWPPASQPRDDLNNTSLILRVTYGVTVFLLTGDSEAPVHRALMAEGEATATVLKVPHHGSKTSDAGFLAGTGATVAVIPVGEGNQFGHPTAEALDALAGSAIFRTDLNGRVRVSSDGRVVRVHTER
ncbi:MAG: ComEC/Rec2 family competence protein [Chloroflexi bacterium]|nr:ComEC/Rec2 family competence protein [Chloroflexota bacterium]